MTARYDWTINQGETSQLTVTRFESDSVTAIPFGGTFRGSVKNKHGGTESLEIENADVAINPDALGTHVIRISLSATKTAAIAAGKYVYDLENLHADATTVTRVLEGSFIVKPEVTT